MSPAGERLWRTFVRQQPLAQSAVVSLLLVVQRDLEVEAELILLIYQLRGCVTEESQQFE